MTEPKPAEQFNAGPPPTWEDIMLAAEVLMDTLREKVAWEMRQEQDGYNPVLESHSWHTSDMPEPQFGRLEP